MFLLVIQIFFAPVTLPSTVIGLDELHSPFTAIEIGSYVGRYMHRTSNVRPTCLAKDQ